MRTARFIVIAALACGFSSGAALAQSGGIFDLSWNTIDGGGGTSTGGAFTLSGTIGQPDAGQPMTGGVFTLVGGFWPGATGTPAACNPSDIAQPDASPGPDGCVNNGDFQLFFATFFSSVCPSCGTVTTVACSPADIGQSDASPGPDGCVDNGDFQLFFAEFFTANCPSC